MAYCVGRLVPGLPWQGNKHNLLVCSSVHLQYIPSAEQWSIWSKNPYTCDGMYVKWQAPSKGKCCYSLQLKAQHAGGMRRTIVPRPILSGCAGCPTGLPGYIFIRKLAVLLGSTHDRSTDLCCSLQQGLLISTTP